jgi:phosphatidylglycerol:prolipoprotein diacylglycerol transferase
MGPGQWFNLAMAAFGLVMLVVCLRRPPISRAAPQAKTQGFGIVSAVILLFLVLFPLSIPTSWTTEYIAIKRTAPETAPAP